MKIISAFSIMLMFISCQSLQEKDYFYSETDLMVHNTKIDKDIKLGMTEQDFLTQFADTYDFFTTNDDTSSSYDHTNKTIKTKGIEVSFTDGILRSFTIDENSKDFILPQDIKFQQSEYYIRKIWGQPTYSYQNSKGKDHDEYRYNYIYIVDPKIKLRSYQEYEKYHNRKDINFIWITFTLNDSQRLISISIGYVRVYAKNN